jgi:hypothetical protein
LLEIIVGEKMSDKTYEIKLRCMNCSIKHALIIPYGVVYKKYLREHNLCNHCGCHIDFNLVPIETTEEITKRISAQYAKMILGKK